MQIQRLPRSAYAPCARKYENLNDDNGEGRACELFSGARSGSPGLGSSRARADLNLFKLRAMFPRVQQLLLQGPRNEKSNKARGGHPPPLSPCPCTQARRTICRPHARPSFFPSPLSLSRSLVSYFFLNGTSEPPTSCLNKSRARPS